MKAIRSSIGLTLALLALALTLGLCAGCGDDNPTNPAPAFDADRTSPEKLIQDWLEKTYMGKDASHYTEALHPDYRFEFLREDAEWLQMRGMLAPGQTWWTHDAEQACAGSLFGSPDVGDISLNVSVDLSEADTTCVDCVLLKTTIDLRITTNPNDSDPLTWAVNSPQEFLVTKDPSDATKWVILRQYDKPRPGALAFPGGPGDLSLGGWGSVKGVYAVSPGVYGGRSTPELLLTGWFETAYMGKNAIDYRKMLYPDFRFEFLPEDAESLQQRGVLAPGVTSWGHGADYTSTQAMFASPNIGDISLNIVIDSDTPDTTCADCRIVETTVDLRMTMYPNDPDPITLSVSSPQTFILKRDPTDPSQWTIRRQFDRQLYKSGLSSSQGDGRRAPLTEQTSWGAIKGLFAHAP